MAEARKSVRTNEIINSFSKPFLICCKCHVTTILGPAGAGPNTKFTCKNCLRTNWAPIPDELKVGFRAHVITREEQRWWDRKCAEERQLDPIEARLALAIAKEPILPDVWECMEVRKKRGYKSVLLDSVTASELMRLGKNALQCLLLIRYLGRSPAEAAALTGTGKPDVVRSAQFACSLLWSMKFKTSCNLQKANSSKACNINFDHIT